MELSMSNHPLLSIIVPVYNTEQYLTRCIDSIINQTYKNIELLLINDGSTDSSLSICRKYEKRYNNIKVVDSPNGGAAHARNIGLDIAKGDYIGFVDSDDYINPNMFELMIKKIIDDNTDICCCGRFDIENGKTTEGLCPKKNATIGNKSLLIMCFNYDGVDFAPWDKVYKKKVWDNNRFPEGYTSEDLYALYNVFLKANSVSLLDERLYFYNHHIDSVSSVLFNGHTFDFEHFTRIILEDITINHHELIDDAKFYRMKSLIYSVSYSGKVSSKDFATLRTIFSSYKLELKQYIEYMNKRQKRIYRVSNTWLTRLYYHFVWKRKYS